jgi:hypothetical protein
MLKLNFVTLKSLGTEGSNEGLYDIIISASLFKMKNSYRDFNIYINDLLKWIKYIPKRSYLRLYVDNTVLSSTLFNTLLDDDKYPDLEIILYECEEFMDSEGYHDGTFGSIIRLIPLFQKPKNVKYIWVTDLDMPIKVYNYKYIKMMLEKNVKVCYYSKACYNKPWSQGLEYPIGAGRIIMNSKINLDYKDFTKFLNDVLKNKYKSIYEEIKEKYENPVKGLKRKMSDVKYFPYGFDELFCNLYLLPVFETYKHIIFFDIGLRAFIDEKVTKIPNNKEYTGLYFKSWATNINVKDYKKLINTTKNIYESVKDAPLDPESYLNACRDDYKKHYKFIDPKSNEIGIVATVIKNPKK